jgi:trimeric autotransporter adhesin
MFRMPARMLPGLYLALVCVLLTPNVVPDRLAARQHDIAGSAAAVPQAEVPRLASGGGATLVKDLVPGSDPTLSSTPREFTTIAGTTYFLATDGSNGRELWRTNGTTAGTALVKDIYPGSGSAFNDSAINPAGLMNVNGTLFFASSNTLLKSDGTATGTVAIRTFVSNQSSLKLYQLTAVGNLLFFGTDDGNGNHGLWRSDGTAAGTFQIKAGALFTSFGNIVDVGGLALFAYAGGLWRSNGSAAGTSLVKDVSPAAMVNANGILFFTVYDTGAGRGLWKSDGTTIGTVQVSDLYPQLGLANVNGTIFFDGGGLWKTDGTPAGTVQVSATPQYISDLTSVGGTLFFVSLGSQGYELWKSDGTSVGTMRVKDLRPDWTGDYFYRLTNVNGVLFFVLDQRAGNGFVFELWRSDGTEAGTMRVLQTVPNAIAPRELANVNGTLLFAGDNVANGLELWKSDGTAGGTMMIKDIGVSLWQTYESSMIGLDNQLFFTHSDVNGGELWISDGTDAGTHLLKDINSGPASSNPDWFTIINNTLFFTADDGTHGIELWKSDGTANGTVQVKDIVLGAGSSHPRALTPVGDMLYFISGDINNELWKTNGAAVGTVLVKDFGAAATNHYLSYLTSFNNSLFFTADDDTHGRELWRSDGTAVGTVMLKDIIPGAESSTPVALTSASGRLFFATSVDRVARQLWRSDGTAAGTVFVKDIPLDSLGVGLASLIPVQDQVFYIAGDGGQGYGLWKSDGTTAGTLLLKQTQITQLDVAGGYVFFANDDGASGLELWRSDGTVAGTTQVADIAPGSSSSLVPNRYRRVIPSGAGIVFTASNGETGMELWQSNGVAADTQLVEDIAPGTGSADPDAFTVAGSQMFFMADDNIHGRELWVMPLPQIQPAGPHVSIGGPITGIAERSYTLTATVSPITDTLPITYIWQADGQASVSHTSGLTDTAAFSWNTPGTRTITVTASNSNGSIGTDTHIITIVDAPRITPANGGVATFPGLTLTFLPGAVSTPVNIIYAPLSMPAHPLGGTFTSLRVFSLEARDSNYQLVTHFAKPYTLTISYTDEQLAALGVDEADLNLAFWDGSNWVNVLPCAGCGVDTTNNRLTAVLDHFTEFALLSGVPAAGDAKSRVYLPVMLR